MEDYRIRAVAGDGQVRAFAASTKNLVEYARTAHGLSPTAAAALGRLLTAGVMMGSMMKGEEDLLTIRIQCDGPIGGLLVTADAAGGVKGYVNNPDADLPLNSEGKLDVSGALGLGVLSVIQDIGLKEPYVGQTILVTGEIADDLTYYYASSEQTPSSVGLGVLLNPDGTVRQAGGFIVQLMPGASEEIISALEKKIGEMSSVTALLEAGCTPEDILTKLLGGFGLEILDRAPARFCCSCSRERIEQVLISVGRKELASMIEDGEPVEVNCQFCGKHYIVSVPELTELLGKAGRV